MNNYKIKVNNEAESREAQDLFEQLGFKWSGDYPENGDWYSHIYAENSYCCYLSPYVWSGLADTFKELTLPQLRDLVVLHRNDVKDATHEAACGTYLFLDSSGDWHFFHKHEAVFYTIYGDISTFVDMPITLIKEQTQQPTEIEQGLISGADALNDYSNAQVSYDFASGEYKWLPLSECGFSIAQILKGHAYADDSFSETKLVFRIKPSTITLNVEIPAPFEPKEGEEFFILAPLSVTGHTKVQGITTQVLLDEYVKLGAWRTEEEIKKVVTALRGGIKG